jgi:hypothetical protein
VPRRPRVDHDQAEVLDSSLLHRFAKRGRLPDGFLALDELVAHDWRLHFLGQCLEPLPRPRGQVDHRLMRAAGFAIEQTQEGVAPGSGTWLPRPHILLRGLVQAVRHDANTLAESAFLAHRGHGTSNLGWLEGVQRVERDRLA